MDFRFRLPVRDPAKLIPASYGSKSTKRGVYDAGAEYHERRCAPDGLLRWAEVGGRSTVSVALRGALLVVFLVGVLRCLWGFGVGVVGVTVLGV